MINGDLIDHTNNPRNLGKLDDPTVEIAYGNLKCEEVLRLYLKVENDTLTDIKYEYFGCGISLPYTSIVSEYIKGKKVEYIRRMLDEGKIDEMINELKTRPCTVITVAALKELMNKLDKII